MRTSHVRWNLQYFGARTVHVTWQFATRVHLGLVFRVSLGFLLGLVLALLRVGFTVRVYIGLFRFFMFSFRIALGSFLGLFGLV